MTTFPSRCGLIAPALVLAASLILQFQPAEANTCSVNSFKPTAAEMVTAHFKQSVRRGKTFVEYDKIVIVWEPFMMVEEPACIDKSGLILEVKRGEDGEWVPHESAPTEMGGGRYKWVVDAVPCRDHYLKFWVDGEGGQASLEYPEPIIGASINDIAESDYTPAAPTDLSVEVLDETSVRVSWTPSECATSYDISYGKTLSSDRQSRQVLASEGSEIILTDGLAPCGEFSLQIYAVIGEQGYSDEATALFATPPDSSAGDKLSPILVPGIGSVDVSWKAFERLSCVASYQVSVCRNSNGECNQETVTRNDALSYLSYKTGDLDECSKYSISIKPLYDNHDLAPKVVDFKTLSPMVEQVAETLGPVIATKGDGQEITVQWGKVKCAEKYEVFQRVDSGSGDWESVGRVLGESGETYISLNGVPCTRYRYGVRVTVGGEESHIVEAQEPIMTHLEATSAFVVPNLEIDALADGAILTWDHGACITSYLVSTCRIVGSDTVCEESVLAKDPTVHNITHEIHGLNACTDYTLKIVPTVEGGDEFTAKTSILRTASPPPTPPQEFELELESSQSSVDLSWSEVECASGYQVLQKLPGSDTEVRWTTNDPHELSNRFQNPEPCVTYSYSVAAVMGEDISEPSEWKEVSVPPRQGISNKPRFEMKDSANGTVSFAIQPSSMNVKCQIEKYEVKYIVGSETMELELDPPVDGDTLELKLPAHAEHTLQGRIKYIGFEAWSPFVAPRGPKAEAAERVTDNSMLVPLIIGILIAIVVIVVVVFFVVKRNKSRAKYDADTAKAGKDETQKLNEHNDAV